ncbi:PAS domain S-box protein [Methyloglobulus sp.]|uniref:PAS domain S-box protein n=1 Tax=Methyloglobulus sp. TaxID=2518622 RepID=UPI003988EC2F
MSVKNLDSNIINDDAGAAQGKSSLKATHQIVALFAVAVLLVALGVAVMFWAFRQIEIASEERKYTFILLNHADDFLSALKDAETGQHGFLLTGDEDFLEPYMAVRDRIGRHLEELRQLTSISAAQKRLDALAPLVDAKLAELAQVIELRRNNDIPAVIVAVGSGKSKHLMDSIRAGMRGFIQIEEAVLAMQIAKFQSTLRQLFALIVTASLFILLFALWFAYLIYRETQQRLKNQVHLETQHLLEIQEATNKQLQQGNVTLRDSEEKLAVTLNSIGEAVIATDAKARVTLLNPVAEQLTGWTQAEATGRQVEEIFQIINQETRQPTPIPVNQALATGEIQSMTNHTTLLVARDGSEFTIANSCAPIRERDGQVIGTVLVFHDVTKEYEVQQALRESEGRLNFNSQMTHTGGWELNLLDGTAHRTLEHDRIFGYDSLLPNWTYEIFLEHVLPDDRAEVDRRFREVTATQTEWNFECRIRRLDGEVRWIWASGQHQCDTAGHPSRMVGIVQDITERKQEIEESRLFFALSQEPLCVVGFDGYFKNINLAWEKALGYSRTDLLTKPLTYFLHPDDRQATQNEIEKQIRIGDSFSFENRYFSADGSCRWFSWSVTTVIQEQLFYCAARDITERKLIEAKLHEAIATADKANLAKSNFLSSMSHELRTPLNAILGFAQLLEAGKPAPTSTQKLKIAQIIKAGWYLLELINEILDLTLIESGKVSLSRESVSLIAVVDECKAMMEPQAQQHDIKLTFLPFDNTLFVYADLTRLKQVLINLLSNAIKYNREHGTIEVHCSVNTQGHLRISINDSGAGLSAEHLTQLFQPFNRLGQEYGNEEGTGIGLVVTKQLVELMGGRIGVESTVGIGSKFWIELIRSVAPQLAAKNTMPEKLTPQAQKNTAMDTLLLYVEDHPANLLLVEQIIEGHPQVNMLSASDGKLGIALARAHLPDVILVDIHLPGISGFQVLKILREDPATAHIPVIALSANAMPRDIEKGLEAGFFRYLTKPIKVNELMSALDDALINSLTLMSAMDDALKFSETQSTHTNTGEKT